MNRRKSIFVMIASVLSFDLFGKISYANNPIIEAWVIAETRQKIESKVCRCKTINEFKQQGLELLPQATRISIKYEDRDKPLLLVDGEGFDLTYLSMIRKDAE